MSDLKGVALSTTHHPRTFRTNRYVYPVLSRRAGGISVGINLNPDKDCNFGCLYCQVDRNAKPSEYFVALPSLLLELETTLTGLRPNGPYWQQAEFSALPPAQQVVRDIAFSGDGEPTTFKNFCEVVQGCVAVKARLNFHAAKTVLITNATGLERPEVQRGLDVMDANQGEVWAKLDAGTPEYFALVSDSRFPFEKVLSNILGCARARPTVIQSCFMRVDGTAPSEAEIGAYTNRLKTLTLQGGVVKLVQIYTLARQVPTPRVSSLSNAEVDAIAARVKAETGLPTATFYGTI